AVHADRVAKVRVLLDAVIPVVVEPVRAGPDERLLLRLLVPQEEPLVVARAEGDEVLGARIVGVAVLVHGAVVVRLEAEDVAAPHLLERQGPDELDEAREMPARLGREGLAAAVALVLPVERRDEFVENLPGEVDAPAKLQKEHLFATQRPLALLAELVFGL